jgi:hypothetical protein
LVSEGIPLDEVLTTKLIGDNPTPNWDDGAKSTSPNVCAIAAEPSVVENAVPDAPPQEFAASARNE